MPTLHWIGKDKIINHHQEVPYKVLNHEYGFSENGKTETSVDTGNLIINGDNLEALKSLLPKYEGKVKCIYIDPPYNTGNESWVYNDNVNSRQMKKWLGNVVGKESEDLTRHDKWLCMMYPRLKLLHKLLDKDGAIFISIDDNEQANLKLMMDEIFGGNNYVAIISPQTNPRGRTLDKYIAKTNEYIIIYTKTNSNDAIFQIPKDEKAEAGYNNSDEFGRYRFIELRNRNPVFNRTNRPNLYYPIYVEEKSGKISLDRDDVYNIEIFPINSKDEEGCWTWGKEKVSNNINLLVGKKVNTGAWRVHRKDYFEGTSLLTKAKSIWLETNINHENGKEVLGEIFGKTPFDFPKSVHLIERCLLIGTEKSSNHLILDCFAGSGTTAHAVLNLNKQDGGNRKFILIEMEHYAETITAERVKRVIGGYANVEATGGSFNYYNLGEPLFDDNNNLNETVGIDKIREYVWFAETRSTKAIAKNANPYLGVHNDTAYYFIYNQNSLTTLDYESLASYIQQKAERYIIYADNCLLPETFLREKNIEFKKIPRDITRF